MKLSVIIIAYDMAREIPRTLQSLARNYQEGAADLEYEVLLVDNGSPEPLQAPSWAGINVPVRLIRIDDAHPSPARAINLAAQQAKGDTLCFMIDGAHILTPGVFNMAFAAQEAFSEVVVAIRYFYLGMEEQTVSINNGYNQTVEDELLTRINWPHEGYRLYDIGTALRAGAKRLTWFNRMFESNCLFMSRKHFQNIGGVDERFDMPGGGFVNLDFFKRAVDAPGVTPVQVIGEGSFHQLHGGTTTNSSGEERDKKLAAYRKQYEELRGESSPMAKASFMYLGHMPTVTSNITAVEKRRARLAGKPLD